jgi:phosphoglycerol transferase MdoB-like AlkP superfamily enzyme
MNSVAETESELISIIRGSRPPTTDHWETVFTHSSAGQFDNGKRILQYAGFDAAVTAEELGKEHRISEYDQPLGFFDDLSLDFFWKYVDNTRARVPKNRMFIGWMTTTTHCPFIIPHEWAKANNRSYVVDDARWHSVDTYLNAVRWTDDKIKEIILGFRERGLENETLFIM